MSERYTNSPISTPQRKKNSGRKRKNLSDTSPKVALMQTKTFRDFIGQVACGHLVDGNRVCGWKLKIISEMSLGCPAMTFKIRCDRGHKSGNIFSLKLC